MFHLSLKILHKNFHVDVVATLIFTYLEAEIFTTNIFMTIMSMPFENYLQTVFKTF